MCNLKLKELIEKTDSEIQIQRTVLEEQCAEKHRNISRKHGNGLSSRRHTLDCLSSLDRRWMSTEEYVSSISSEINSFKRSLPDEGKVCLECSSSATFDKQQDSSLELCGEAMKPFYHMWSRSQEVKVIGRGKLEPPRALTRQGMYRECDKN
ncbi:hypothetical protein CHS0354_029799 [Potamilus streckersoni]|uniref:Uncharacterized protein n=1 Tax=Potamilus streckersoni TaxID=2493646 RepID=A0AAE0TH78_9BIVA|nr:hypothetical protein CHS0354_029799 [Potamilus streckersoni]